MEHTGRYYEPLVCELSQSDLFVSAVNPKFIKDFGDNSLRKVKSDKADAVKIARYTLDSWAELKQYSLMDEIRNQLKTMNHQFDFYMKHKTAMKTTLSAFFTRLIPVQIPISVTLPGRSDANIESTTSSSQKLLKSMKYLRKSFLYFQKTIWQN